MSPRSDEQGTRSTRHQAWLKILATNSALSARYRSRYAVVLADLERGTSPGEIDAAREIAGEHPRRAAEILAGATSMQTPAPGHGPAPVVEGNGPIALTVQELLAGCADVDAWCDEQPPLEQTNVPLHPSRCARLISVACPPYSDLVALKWAASSVADRQRNERTIRELADQVHDCGGFRIDVPANYALVRVSTDTDPWVIAPNYGRTLEDQLRSSALSQQQRQRVIQTLVALRTAMIDRGLIWQGFAPRNMFLRNDQLVLIDFEEVADARHQPARAAECLVWHKIFFADSLDCDEFATLFRNGNHTFDVPDDHQLKADAFERALLGRDQVTWSERRELLEQSLMLEGRHRRPSDERDDGLLYGHELGHYWGDFLPVEHEARLFRELTQLTESETLTACLEVFEAAMEADLCRLLRDAASGSQTSECFRTIAVVDALDESGPLALADRRRAENSWYARLAADPALLVDTLLLHLGTAVDNDGSEPFDTYLVGATTTRKQQTDYLTRTVEAGIGFLYGDDRDERFLRHAPSRALKDLVAEPLPATGQDFDSLLTHVNTTVAAYSIAQSHPGYLAFPDSGNALGALAGSVLSPLLNQNLIAVDRSAPVATFVEIQVIEWLREMVGYPSAPLTELRGVRDVAGLWATGGHLSNHLAMLAALGAAFPDARRHGLRSLDVQPAVIMAGPIAHYSHSDAAFHLGLGWNAVLPVPALPGYTTDPEAVDAVLSNPPAGIKPFMVIGVAGNCRTTGLDNLRALADVCRRHNVWFHVDACHGGSLIFNRRLRDRHLAGIELSDSVSLDPHKGLFTPYPSSYVVFRERGVLTQFSRHEKAVLDDDCWDLGLITPFLGSRGFESLPTWMLLKHVGTEKLGAMVQSRQALVRYLDRRLQETGLFIRLNDVDFYRLTFVFCPNRVRAMIADMRGEDRRRAIDVVNRFTSRINTALYEDGRVCFDEHTLADLGNRVGLGDDAVFTVMACCPGNPLITQADLDRAIRLLVEESGCLVEELTEALTSPSAEHPDVRVLGPAGWSDAS